MLRSSSGAHNSRDSFARKDDFHGCATLELFEPKVRFVRTSGLAFRVRAPLCSLGNEAYRADETCYE